MTIPMWAAAGLRHWTLLLLMATVGVHTDGNGSCCAKRRLARSGAISSRGGLVSTRYAGPRRLHRNLFRVRSHRVRRHGHRHGGHCRERPVRGHSRRPRLPVPRARVARTVECVRGSPVSFYSVQLICFLVLIVIGRVAPLTDMNSDAPHIAQAGQLDGYACLPY